MSITLDQNKMLIQMIKEFTANELAPLDMEIDQRGDYTDGLFQKVVDTGRATVNSSFKPPFG